MTNFRKNTVKLMNCISHCYYLYPGSGGGPSFSPSLFVGALPPEDAAVAGRVAAAEDRQLEAPALELEITNESPWSI